MMFSGLMLKQKKKIRILACILLAAIIVVNVLELQGISFFNLDAEAMMVFDNFALLFTLIAGISTLAYFLLSAKDMQNVGVNYSDYFALIFFIFSGMALVASFKSMLIRESMLKLKCLL